MPNLDDSFDSGGALHVIKLRVFLVNLASSFYSSLVKDFSCKLGFSHLAISRFQ